MAWRRPGDKPLSEPMMVSLLTHICVARPQWVNPMGSGCLFVCQWTGSKWRDDVSKWEHFPCYWPFVRGIHWSPREGQWYGALMFSSMCLWTNGWTNSGVVRYLRHHDAHCDFSVMWAQVKASHLLHTKPYLKQCSFIVSCVICNKLQWTLNQSTKFSVNKMHFRMVSAKWQPFWPDLTGIILCICPANERRCYNVTSSVIGWAHSQNNPCLNSLAPGRS